MAHALSNRRNLLRADLTQATGNSVESARDASNCIDDIEPVRRSETWFFVGHDDNARRNADALTLLTTCHKMGIDPRAYLRDTLRRLLAGEKDLSVLLPESYAARVKAATATATATAAAA